MSVDFRNVDVYLIHDHADDDDDDDDCECGATSELDGTYLNHSPLFSGRVCLQRISPWLLRGSATPTQKASIWSAPFSCGTRRLNGDFADAHGFDSSRCKIRTL